MNIIALLLTVLPLSGNLHWISGFDYDYTYDYYDEEKAEVIDYKDPCKAGK